MASDDFAAVNTFELSLCEHCDKMTFVFMDSDGQRWCPVCKEKK